MISGLWANTNLDDGKQTRQKALRDIEENYQTSLNLIYSTEDKELDYEEIDPLFAAMNLDDVESTSESLPTTTTNDDLGIDQINSGIS